MNENKREMGQGLVEFALILPILLLTVLLLTCGAPPLIGSAFMQNFAVTVDAKNNRVRFARLINLLKNRSRYQGDFCWEMARAVETHIGIELYNDILSPRQFEVVREVWGKTTGDRRNSKAYKAAVEEFDRLFDASDDMSEED